MRGAVDAVAPVVAERELRRCTTSEPDAVEVGAPIPRVVHW
ncbi:MAG: hypothetical protein ACLGI2_05880 [Acidimicrobiia bacterium]